MKLNRKALTAGAAAALAVVAAIWLGSRALTHFDLALVWDAVGWILAAIALAYRFALWAQRPPSRLYFKRGLQLLFKRYSISVSRSADPASRFNAFRLRGAPKRRYGATAATLQRSNVTSPAQTMAHAAATR